MVLISKFSFSLCFLCISFIAFASEILTGKVVAVADGDTITILNSNFQQVKIRLHGIDCPEKSQDFGQKATSDLCYGKTVEVQALDTDRYGRTIGLVKLPDGKVLNKELLKAGLAWHYKHYDKSADFASLEETAKKK
ncbi:thermonuclease family protein [Pedobacter sp. P351]|uniref:thermonuclease family protein n=1 Tax=Pedobacter superstes TaxID=3133441 RepID=UPI0030A88478